MPLNFLKKLATGLGQSKGEGVKRWHHAEAMDQGYIKGACFAMDRHGRGHALWENSGKLWTQELGPGLRESVGRFPLADGREPSMAMNLEGRGAAVWIFDRVFEKEIIGLPFNPASDEKPATRTLFRSSGEIHHLQLAVDRRGSAMIVWCHESGGRWETQVKAFDIRAKKWDEHPTRLGAELGYDPEPRLAMNRRGQAVVIWQERNPGAEGLVVSHFLPSARQWSDQPMPLASGLSQEHQVAMDMAGNIMALWVVHPYGKQPILEATRFSATRAEWSPPQVLATAKKIQDLHLTMTGTGEALALWRQSEGTSLSFLYSKAFHARAWDDRLIRLDAEGGQAGAFTVALGSKGQAALLSIQHAAKGDLPVFRNRGLDWEAPVRLAHGSHLPLSQPLLAICPKGIVAVWKEGSGKEALLKMAEFR